VRLHLPFAAFGGGIERQFRRHRRRRG
jgi:hypothetical protein